VWERAGRLQDACDGSYFNGLPLFTYILSYNIRLFII